MYIHTIIQKVHTIIQKFPILMPSYHSKFMQIQQHVHYYAMNSSGKANEDNSSNSWGIPNYIHFLR
jgi:hypothetical protein